MEANSFYGQKFAASGSLANSPKSADVTMFNSGGAGSTKELNTTPLQGFKNAIGNSFYGADGDGSATTTTATPATSGTAVTTTTSFTTMKQPIGFNLPSLLLLAAGFGIAYYFTKEKMM